jgi:hypothetical protein
MPHHNLLWRNELLRRIERFFRSSGYHETAFEETCMNIDANNRKWAMGSLAVLSFLLAAGVTRGTAQNQKPNIVILMTDDTGWNHFVGCLRSRVRFSSVTLRAKDQ